MTNDYIKTGSPIYARSFEIIREESNLGRFPEDVEPVVVRMIHAAADPAIADLIAFTPGVAAAALKAAGRPDVYSLKGGIDAWVQAGIPLVK